MAPRAKYYWLFVTSKKWHFFNNFCSRNFFLPKLCRKIFCWINSSIVVGRICSLEIFCFITPMKLPASASRHSWSTTNIVNHLRVTLSGRRIILRRWGVQMNNVQTGHHEQREPEGVYNRTRSISVREGVVCKLREVRWYLCKDAFASSRHHVAE